MKNLFKAAFVYALIFASAYAGIVAAGVLFIAASKSIHFIAGQIL